VAVQLATALLCDAASVRENLLNVLGGGISAITREMFPAPLNVDLALVLAIHPSELAESHLLRVRVVGEDGQEIAAIDGQFGPAQVSGPQPRSEVQQPLVLPLRHVGVPTPGRYSVEINVDKTHLRSLDFEVSAAIPELFGEASEF
jgi:hypothetical protein